MDIFHNPDQQDKDQNQKRHEFFGKMPLLKFTTPKGQNNSISDIEEILLRSFRILFAAVGLVCILILLFPFFRFIYECSCWAFKKSGALF